MIWIAKKLMFKFEHMKSFNDQEQRIKIFRVKKRANMLKIKVWIYILNSCLIFFFEINQRKGYPYETL